MSLQVKGMQELVDYFDKIGNTKAPKKALKKASEHVREVEVDVLTTRHTEYATGKGAKELKSGKIRTKKKRSFVEIGIKDKISNWENAKGAYFNHYGFYHNAWRKDGTAKNRKAGKFSPRYIAGSRWMDEAFDKSKDKAYKIMEEELLKEFNNK